MKFLSLPNCHGGPLKCLRKKTPLPRMNCPLHPNCFSNLLPDDEPDQLQSSEPTTVYTTMVTLWMLILQRFGGDMTLNAVVKDILSHDRDLLPNNKRIQERTVPDKSGAYSEARTRVDIKSIEFFTNRVSDSRCSRFSKMARPQINASDPGYRRTHQKAFA